MAADAALQLQASVTKTGTFHGTAVTLPSGTPRRGLFARVIYSAATNAGDDTGTVTFSVDVSPDSGTTWYEKTVDNEHVVNLNATAKSGEFPIPFETSDTQVRLSATFAGSGSTPTITYESDIVLGRPG